MRLFFRQWPHAVAGVLVLTILLNSKTAFGQSGQPGESNSYTPENIGPLIHSDPEESPFRELQTDNSYSEARTVNTHILLRVWRGQPSADNPAPAVWMAFGNGAPFTLGTTATYVAPTVVPFAQGWFMVFHTGTNGGIYYTIVYGPNASNDNAQWVGSWQAIPGQTTNMPVSVTQFNSQNGNLYLVYRGAGSDTTVYGTWLDGNGWHFGGPIGPNGGGQAVSAPSITYNPVTNQLLVAASGTDNAVWTTHQSIGASSWPAWTPQDFLTTQSPEIAAGDNGDVLISLVSTARNPWYRLYDQNMNPINNWTEDTTGWVTYNPVMLSVIASSVWALLVGRDNVAYYKAVYQP